MNDSMIERPVGAPTTSTGSTALKAKPGVHRAQTIRPNAGVKRGVLLIYCSMMKDFDNGFERHFPDLDEAQEMDLTAAIEWLEQYLPDNAWEVME